jgi:hypothetical protein
MAYDILDGIDKGRKYLHERQLMERRDAKRHCGGGNAYPG